MAMLKAKTRNKLPASEFGEPGDRKYPMPDRSHAGNAKARAKQQLDAGKLSRGEYDKIVAKANRKLGDPSTRAHPSTRAQDKQSKDLDDYVARKYGPQ
jgi:hypothetical protein